MKKIVFMTCPDAANGFALTGVRQLQLETQQFMTELEAVCAEHDVGVVAVDARLVQDQDQARLREFCENWNGVLVMLPAPVEGVEVEEDELQRLVRRALGYHVRL